MARLEGDLPLDEDIFALLESLCQLLHRSGLSELAVEEGESKIRLRRGFPEPAAAPSRERWEAGPAGERPLAGKADRVEIRSPLVGIFYRSPAPDAPAFVEVGDRVGEGDPVGVVEAMKVFNEILAPTAGRVMEVVPANGELVQAEQLLVVLEKG